jgi:glutathione S-transferase
MFVAEGDMTLYVKAGPDGTSVGDCPFAHFVRMVLELKQLEYELQPCVQDTKPQWLIEYYDGKMPALRHRRECYVESDTIASYLDFFFREPSLRGKTRADEAAAEAAAEGLFPALAQYLKHTTDGDDADMAKKETLRRVFQTLDDHFAHTKGRSGPYLVGDGSKICLLDCRLAPVLYHAVTGIRALKGGAIDLATDFPALHQYTKHMFENEPAFVKTVYPPEVVAWGWGNARS